MRTHDAGPELIGREHPAALLRAEISRVTGSHGGLVLVTGEAGIGKTTLVTSAAEQAREQGALVLSGSCWHSDAAPGYWPWVQVIRALRRGGEWPAVEEAAGGRLSALLGDGARVDGADAFEVYDAVTTALVTLSQTRPVVVVLDDLHWADGASLKLLEFAAQHTWFERLLLIGTYRDVEVEQGEHPLRPLLTPLAARATMITLTGLDRAQVAALVTRTIGHEPDDDVVQEIHRRTGGNPFFVEQTARLWRSGGSVSAIPPGVRDTLWRRLSLLPAPVVRLLTDAAVLGREFHRQVLAAVAAAPAAHVDRLLAQAAAARLVGSQGGGVFSFAHDLVRETLYDSLDEADLRARHAATVHALRDLPDAMPGELARHAYLAGEAVDPALATDLLVAAARQANQRLAREEALLHWRRAMELAGSGDPRRLVRIGLEFGRLLHHGGESDESARVFDRAVATVRALDDPELLARAALTLFHTCGREESGRGGAALLREAHHALVGAPPAGDPPTPDRLAQDLAVRISVLARKSDDDEALTFALWALHDTIWGPGTARQRVELTEELRGLARRTGDVDMEHFTSALHWVALLELGDPRFPDQFRHYVAMGRASDQPNIGLSTSIDQSIIDTLTGDFARAEALMGEVMEVGGGHGHTHFGYMLDHHRWAMLLAQGRLSELEEVHERLRASRHPCPGLLEALSDLRRGHGDPALLRAMPEPADDGVRPVWLRFLAEAAGFSRDPDLCAQAREALEPHLGEWAVSLYGWDISGPVVLWMGVVAAAEERWDEAIDCFTSAVRAAELLRARPWSVEARLRLGAALTARGRPGDAETADRLLTEVAAEAADLGIRDMTDRLSRIRQERPAAGGDRGTGWREDPERGPRAGEPWAATAGPSGGSDARRSPTTDVSGRTNPPSTTPPPEAHEQWPTTSPGSVDGGPTTMPEFEDATRRPTVSPGGVHRDSGGGRGGRRPSPPNAPGAAEPSDLGSSADRANGSPPDVRGDEGLAGSGGSGDRTFDAGRTGDPRPDVRGDDGVDGSAGRSGRISDTGRVGGARLSVSGEGSRGSEGSLVDRDRAPGNEFRREGSVWSLSFGGRTVHMPDAKGLRDLHTLLSRPGAELPAVQLLAPEGGEVVVAARRMGGDPVLDEEAKARYHRHLTRLDEETERALELGDDRRAAELDRERAALLEELRAAAGLGGRARRLGDEAERARKTVTARIRDVLRKLDALHPELAAHLRDAVSTGTTCRYHPNPGITWRL
ncbi:AAA family ATPase [Nonomuraea africana]|uniref:Type II secretory pathway predicted ATPase ExeA/tetratricopeptide (TPR) repeat protein n=1 Tax=Nonomuraea africana TaxID=46171 RepID=A0ABR9K940_9ACTN|nr:AAA family ATPase [Nonomuraea africana]MBE1558519.1 type II secretory pathway predicted ATPase ExeA/tetratricopeptide (TPR) repeat protein [Nonomuraea africana]